MEDGKIRHSRHKEHEIRKEKRNKNTIPERRKNSGSRKTKGEENSTKRRNFQHRKPHRYFQSLRPDHTPFEADNRKIPASRPEEVGALGTRHSEVARWVITAHFPRDGDICSTHSLYFLISSPCRSFSSPIPYPCLSFYIPLATNLSSVFLSMSISSSFSLPVVLFPSLSPYRFLFPFPRRFFLCLPSLSLSLSVCLLPPPLLPSPHCYSLFLSTFYLSISVTLFLASSSSGIAYVQVKEKSPCLCVNKILLIKRRANEFFTEAIYIRNALLFECIISFVSANYLVLLKIYGCGLLCVKMTLCSTTRFSFSSSRSILFGKM